MNIATPKRRFDFYPLEDRVLLSGDGIDPGETSPDAQSQGFAEYLAELSADGQATSSTETTAEGSEEQVTDTAESSSGSRIEVVLIDSSVEDSETLLSNLRSSTDNGDEIQWMVYQLNSDQDGIEQISSFLAGLTGVDAIHLVSSGDGEGLQLGNTRLDMETAAGYAGEIALWSQSLQADADLLIYGSSLASTEDGRNLLETLAIFCDCDVAASSNPTGHRSLGGDWELEYVLGTIQSASLISLAGQEQWNSVLQVDNFSEAEAADASTTDYLRRELVFIDSSVTNYMQLVDDLQFRDSISHEYIIWILSGESDGIAQISEALAAYEGLDAVHIVSHGEASGAVKLGASWLSLDNLEQYSGEIAGWSAAFAADADLLIYGCDVAASPSGQTLLQTLSELTGADVAASIDGTGHTAFGGNWQFEFTIGVIDTQQAFSEAMQESWQSVLALETVRDNFSTAAYTNNNGTMSWSTAWTESDSQGGGSSSGNIYISGGNLYVNAHTTGNNIYRQADLSDALDATLSFSYTSGLSASATIYIQASSNGGATYTTLTGGTFNLVANTGSGNKSFDISSYIASNTRIRFYVASGETGAGNNSFFVDNVEIAYTTNTAPVLDNSGTMALTTITENEASNAGNTVAAIIASAGGDRITDPDSSALEGIAITSLTSGNGSWQYSLNGGSTWTNIGVVSESSALLLRATDLVRFIPNGENGTSAEFTLRAWDQTSGSAGIKVDTSTNGGTTAFSIGADVASITVTDVNDAPELSGASDLNSIDEDPVSNPGTLVSALVAGHVTDVDSGALGGMAVTSTDDTNGTWQYSLDGGSSWNDFGSVSDGAARLLPDDGSTRIRFVPNADWNGVATIGFRAWDQTAGTAGGTYNIAATGGTTAFSTATGTSNLTVDSVNDAPVVTVQPGDSDSTSLAETDTGHTAQGTLTATDVDPDDTVGGSVTGLVVSGTTAGLQSDNATLLAMLSVTANVIANGDTTGTLTWDFDSGTEAFDYLAVGESVTLTYTITVTDTPGVTDTHEVTITITGTNDAPLISVEIGDSDAAALGANGATLTADGTLSLGDLDLSDAVTAAVSGITKSGDTVGLPLSDAQLQAMLTVNSAVIDGSNQQGTISWQFDSDSESFGYLAQGESLTLVYEIMATDSQGISDTHEVTIVITGANTPPGISLEPGDSESETLAETDAAVSVSGTLSVTDTNTTDIVTADVSSVVSSGTTTGLASNNAALLAMLTVDPNVIDGLNGSGTLAWDFDSGSDAFDYLAVGEALTLTYTLNVTDTAGATDTQEVTITITGTNDAPEVTIQGGDSGGEVIAASGATITANGTLSVEDLDRSDEVTAGVSGFSKSGDLTGLGLSDAQLQAMLTVNTAVIDDANQQGTISWQFDSGGEAFDYLAQGESLTLVYEITATDTQGGVGTRDITIVINGTNAPPVISVEPGDSTGETVVETDTGLSTSGTLSVSDANTTDIVTADVSSVVASGTLAGLQPNNASLLAMLSANPNVIDGLNTSGTLTWDFDSGSEAFNYLAAGETLTLTFTLSVTDTAGATDTQDVVITISGTNDAPAISLEAGDSDSDTLAANGTTLTTDGTLSVEDLDRSDDVTAGVSGFSKSGDVVGLGLSDAQLQAMLSVNTIIVDGSNQQGTITWQFDSDGEAFGYLAVGESLTLVYEITVTDTQGGSDTSEVTIVINGTNTAPLISIELGDSTSETLAETDAGLDASGTLSVSDANTTDVVTATVDSVVVSGTTAGLVPDSAALLAMLSINANVIDSVSNSGILAWDFDSGSESFDYLAVGESLTLTYALTVTDSHGIMDTQEITITITGTNDAPEVSLELGDTDSVSIVEDTNTIISVGSLTIYDADLTNQVTADVTGLLISGHTAGLTSNHASLLGMLSVTQSVIDAASQLDKLYWSFDSGSEVFSHLWTGKSLILRYSVTVSDTSGADVDHQIVITIHGDNQFPVASGDSYSIRAGETLTVVAPGPLGNDMDPDGDPLQLVLVSGPSNGVLTVSANGSFTYVPNPGFIGIERIQYRAGDGRLLSNLVEITINVTALGGSSESSGSGSQPPQNGAGSAPGNDGPSTGVAAEEVYQESVEAVVEEVRSERNARDSQGDQIPIQLQSRMVSSLDASSFLTSGRTAEPWEVTTGHLPRLSSIENLQRRYMAIQLIREDLENAISWGSTALAEAETRGFGFGLGAAVIGSSGVTIGAVTAGYVLWAARGAALLATVASSMPAWRNLDPASLLSDYRASRGESSGDDELESMIGR